MLLLSFLILFLILVLIVFFLFLLLFFLFCFCFFSCLLFLLSSSSLSESPQANIFTARPPAYSPQTKCHRCSSVSSFGYQAVDVVKNTEFFLDVTVRRARAPFQLWRQAQRFGKTASSTALLAFVGHEIRIFRSKRLRNLTVLYICPRWN